MMVERTLYRILEAGLNWFKEDARRFSTWLVREQLIEESEAETARVFFEGQPLADPPVPPKAPHLVHGYARTGGPFPCVALTLGAEDIASDYLGREGQFLGEDELEDLSDDEAEFYDDEGRPLDPETGEARDPHVRRLRYNFSLMIHAEHPDVCVWYYHLIKWILMSSHAALEAANVEDMAFSGRDMAPDPRYLPDDIFTRMITVTCEGDETWDAEFTAQLAQRVTGLFEAQDIDTTALAAAGDAAGVTTYTAELDHAE